MGEYKEILANAPLNVVLNATLKCQVSLYHGGGTRGFDGRFLSLALISF